MKTAVSKYLLLIAFFMQPLFLLHAAGAPSQTTPALVTKKADPLSELFKKTMNDVQVRLKIINRLFENVTKQINQAHYKTNSKIEILEQDPLVPDKMVGLIIDFGDAGHGKLDAFDGFTIDVRIDIIPDALLIPLTGVVKELIKDLLKCQTTRDDVTGKVTLKSSPVMEFLFKMVLLAKDGATKAIDSKSFAAESTLLMYRLAQVPNLPDMNAVLEQIPGPLAPVVKGIKIAGKSFDEHLTIMWQSFLEIFNYDFDRVDKTELDVKDLPVIIKVMTAIILRATTDYTKAKDAKLGLGQVKSDATNRFVALFTRFKLYRMIKDKILDAIRPIANPLLAEIGLTIDDLLPADSRQFKPSMEDESLIASADALLNEDPFLSPELSSF